MITLDELKSSRDWEATFDYANGFTRNDVAEIRNAVEGENAGDEWIVWGRLHDGHWFYLHAGCDYTGWDCHARGDSAVASTEEELIRMGMDFGARQRFGIPQPT